MKQAHYLHPHITTGKIRVIMVGCGGNGSNMLMGLASLNTALREMTDRFLDVHVIDDDVVSQANLGRQPFYPCDVGRSKAVTLVERINYAHGLAWTAQQARFTRDMHAPCDLLISCVDTAASRREIQASASRKNARYWLDLGNRARDGQFILGTTKRYTHTLALPSVMDMFPELADESIPEDDAPSCSLAEALQKQSLFMNRVLSSHALDLLFNLLCRGSITNAGGFLNLASGYASPVPLPKMA